MKMQRYIDLLPHGSGVNYDYKIKEGKNKITVYNKYDYMDENGYYDDIFPFSVTFTAENVTLHFHNLTRWQYKKIEHNGLRDYLEEIFYDVREKVLKVGA
ncbi:hypothetical protein [Selenomonas ruminantium]|uniref:Uncharacterized protein n=1 Tax=Selenomonas ruminantium TaxID=971 RepID=A0A1I0YA03_SELRU|nr:hypothetical protein [Selenomonas ruminantium]SFB10104.1 hypothetical protein SAMN05216587_11132 [Selenomonas ruminantium]